jgi:hypothetical protein
MGCIANRFPGEKLDWEASNLRFTGEEGVNRFLRRSYRKGWEVEGL